MPFIAYKEIAFQRKSLRIIDQANIIIDKFAEEGFTLTLRQLYYQFVARDWIANNQQSYDRLGDLVTKARLCGLIDWNAIEDRERGINEWLIEEDEREPLRDLEYHFSMDFWKPQGKYIEVWVEKKALGSVIERPCRKYRVPHMPCKGYLSASEAWRAGQRFEGMMKEGRECILIHLGDHDPSGIDMTRDNEERLEMFAGWGVDVRRVALNIDQVRRYDPPPNYAKETDKRTDGYRARFGDKCWELDALDPNVINELIESQIKGEIDQDIWDETDRIENEGRKYLKMLYGNWPAVREFLADMDQ